MGAARCAGACLWRSCASASPPGRERETHCVCVRHTARRRLWGVQLVRRLELGAGGEPHALRRRRSLPSAHRHVCVIAGLRGER